nr:MAG TPA: hypothetical protein [Caudoviricetes sp.]
MKSVDQLLGQELPRLILEVFISYSQYYVFKTGDPDDEFISQIAQRIKDVTSAYADEFAKAAIDVQRKISTNNESYLDI